MGKLLLGIDIGTSSVKVSVIDSTTQNCLTSQYYPELEADIISLNPGWAEQNPDTWWEYTQAAILKANATGLYNSKEIAAIGISYQMHGLVLVDKNKKLLRNSIIWCDSRAVSIGNKAFADIGADICLQKLLNSPGNLTASKLAWVKENEPELYEKIDKIMLPGDYISLKFSGQITTSISSLSEGIFWDYAANKFSEDVFSYFGFSTNIIPEIKDVFSEHGKLESSVAASLSLTAGIPITYKAGDQPNNALSLNVMKPGEVAATAGTSGVIYGITDQLISDSCSRVNTFAHVNYTESEKRLGVLLCINGTGILNRWVKNIGNISSYQQMNQMASNIPVGSDGLHLFPFGNGAERMLENKIVGSSIEHIDFNKHSIAHLCRAAQEGIVFAFRYGLDIMKENKMNPAVIRAGKANMFLSEVFREIFVNTLGVPVELYNNDGSAGAAIGAGLGVGIYSSATEAFATFKPLSVIEPTSTVPIYDELYHQWKIELLNKTTK